MEKREDLESILPFLPLILRSSSLFWPPKALEALKALSMGPDTSMVDSGEVLFDAILDIRDSLGLSTEKLASKAAQGYTLFFDQLMSRADSRKWFGEVVPELASLILRLPSMLETYYRNEGGIFGVRKTGLRILGPQEPGIVFLSQELIAALLACSMFCLFPITDRNSMNLPTINFDHLFGCLHLNGKQNQEHKIKCLIHYFERISLCMPVGFVSFERKVLPFDFCSHCIPYPEASFWENSTLPLCSFEVSHLGLIEDQEHEALEVDFANKYMGGGALHGGCVQEEIRFMINPELIAGMLFLPSMEDNEAIEVVGAERYSKYMGANPYLKWLTSVSAAKRYASSFRFMGDYLDKKPVDSVGRRRTRIVALDALYSPGMRQYEVECLVREANKAFCGFLDQSKHQCYLRSFQECVFCIKQFDQVTSNFDDEAENIVPVGDGTCLKPKNTLKAPSDHEGAVNRGSISNSSCARHHLPVPTGSTVDIGVATGNWGCGAFGGDPELKFVIQWLATSQALRPFILYFTFGAEALQRLEQVTHWILSHGWTVGDLWIMLFEYSCQRLSKKTSIGFVDWLLPDPNLQARTDDADYMTQ